MCANHSLCPPLGGSPKALEVTSFVGLLLCLVYVTTFRSFRMKAASSAWVIATWRDLKRPLSTASSIAAPTQLGNPDVHLPVSPLSTGFAEPLNALGPFQSGMAFTHSTRTVTRNARF